jgi:hypothetical protein
LERERLERERIEKEKKKRKYDSVLDSAWDLVSKKPDATETKSTEDAEKKDGTKKVPVVEEGDSYPSSPEYYPIPKLDLQTPSLMMEEFVQKNPNFEESVAQSKQELLDKVEQGLTGIWKLTRRRASWWIGCR